MPLSLLADISFVSFITIGSVDLIIASSTLLLNAAGKADLMLLELLVDLLFDERLQLISGLFYLFFFSF